MTGDPEEKRITNLSVICLQRPFCKEKLQGTCVGTSTLGGGAWLSGDAVGPGPTGEGVPVPCTSNQSQLLFHSDPEGFNCFGLIFASRAFQTSIPGTKRDESRQGGSPPTTAKISRGRRHVSGIFKSASSCVPSASNRLLDTG